MKLIKSLGHRSCRSAAMYGIGLSTFILTLSFPLIAAPYIYFLGMSSKMILALLIQYLITFLLTGIIGGAFTGYLFALSYDLFSSTNQNR